MLILSDYVKVTSWQLIPIEILGTVSLQFLYLVSLVQKTSQKFVTKELSLILRIFSLLEEYPT